MTISYDKQVLIKRGNTASVGTYVGPLGELVLDTDTNQVYVHDGVTVGGNIVGDEAAIATLTANAAAQSAQISQLQTDITTANTSMKDYVDNSISANITAIVGGAPGALDTLNELANALGNNASFSTTITNSLASLTSNVSIQAGQIAAIGANIGTGNITFADTTISAANDSTITVQALDSDSAVRSKLNLIPSDGAINMQAFGPEDSRTFDSTDWATATWASGAGAGLITITGAASIYNFINSDLNNATGITFNINGSNNQSLGGWGYATAGQTLTIYTDAVPDPDPTTLTGIEFFYRFSSQIDIDYDSGDLLISAYGEMNVEIRSDQDIRLYAMDDVSISGTDSFSLRNSSSTDPIQIVTDDNNTGRTWLFNADGTLSFPNSTIQTTAWTGTVNYANVTNTPILANVATSGDYSDLINIPVAYGNVNVAAYLTTNNYATENYVDNSLANISLPSSYNDGNVVSLLSAFGSNSITTTGNIAGNTINVTGSVNTGGTLNFTSAEATDTAKIFTDVSSTTTSMVLEVGDDNSDKIVLRHYSFDAGNTLDMLSAQRSSNTEANVTIIGNLTTTNQITATGSINSFGDLVGNATFASTLIRSLNLVGTNAVMKIARTTDGGDPAVELQALNPGNAAILSYWDFFVEGDRDSFSLRRRTGGIEELALTASSTGVQFPTGNILVTGSITGSNLISSATIYGNVDVILGNIANVSAAKTRVVSDNAFSYIQTGNGTVGSTGKIVFSPYFTPTQQVVIDTASGNISATGNITAQNFIGNIRITGNVTGTSANVDLVAGANTWSFDNTGNLTFPDSTVQSTAYVAADNVVKVTGSWTVTSGTANYSFTVPDNGVYQLWVRGNIPNGIITYTATVSVTNTNVPVIGQQFAWNYEGAGNPIMLTSIPDQIIGTAGTISNANPTVGATTNTFVFGISNTSGGNVTVDYGYTTIS